MAGISIGDPAIIFDGNAALFYVGIIAAISASVFAWWYVNHERKAKNRTKSPAAH